MPHEMSDRLTTMDAAEALPPTVAAGVVAGRALRETVGDSLADAPATVLLTRRALDVLVAGSVLLLLSPLLLIVSLAVRFDSAGPIFFRQQRLGRSRQPFTVYKFRTMVQTGDEGAHRDYVAGLIAGGRRQNGNGPGKLFKPPMARYVTRTGVLLRRWSVDEIPQLWNVLRGDMSLVGPRPVTAYEAALYPGEWAARFAVRPGLTGLWQVSGRNHLTYVEMIDLDLEYVRRRSLRLDVQILARTVPTVLLRRGAS
jgi:lipopolysaccharide/colanic/teichoic acid biosynthesis glycosyltransferase